MYACGSNNPGFGGGPEVGGIYAIEPFNTTGEEGMIENVPPLGSSNILRVTGNVKIRKALAKGKLKPLGATMARYIEERYNTLPFAERWAYPLLAKPFPEEEDATLRKKWEALVKKLTSIRFLEVYAALRDVDGGIVGQFEHTVYVAEGGTRGPNSGVICLQYIVFGVFLLVFTTIIYRRLPDSLVQDERFSLSASHPLAIVSRPVHPNGLAVMLFANCPSMERPSRIS
jgi:hypothetical protein